MRRATQAGRTVSSPNTSVSTALRPASASTAAAELAAAPDVVWGPQAAPAWQAMRGARADGKGEPGAEHVSGESLQRALAPALTAAAARCRVTCRHQGLAQPRHDARQEEGQGVSGPSSANEALECHKRRRPHGSAAALPRLHLGFGTLQAGRWAGAAHGTSVACPNSAATLLAPACPSFRRRDNQPAEAQSTPVPMPTPSKAHLQQEGGEVADQRCCILLAKSCMRILHCSTAACCGSQRSSHTLQALQSHLQHKAGNTGGCSSWAPP